MNTMFTFSSEISDVVAKSREYYPEMFIIKNATHIVFNGPNKENLHYDIREKTWKCSCTTHSGWESRDIPGYKHYCSHIVAVEKLFPELTSSLTEKKPVLIPFRTPSYHRRVGDASPLFSSPFSKDGQTILFPVPAI